MRVAGGPNLTVPPSGGASGTPASTVTNSAVGDANVVGVGTNYAREDHQHGREAFAAPSPLVTAGTASTGTAVTVVHSDHVHAIPATLDTNARVAVIKNTGAVVGTRRAVNFIEGTNITLTVTDVPGSERVDITIAGPASSGEANTASNLGSGTGLFASKAGVDLQFKSITAGAGLSISSTATDVTLVAVQRPLTVVTKTTTYTAVTTDDVILVSAAASWTLALYTAVGNAGRVLSIKKTDASSTANVITVDPNAAETIDGNTTYKLLTQYETLVLVSDGTNWLIV